ncbi:MAG: hypothetical protein LBD75_07220 [Candidatus Peribacteria bacterium]|jgi:hypothetical protein|nr:hypothetical protein [Candidatus Peribacteria bacterium]
MKNNSNFSSKKWNNKFPQATEALNNAKDDLQEIKNNRVLFGQHLSQIFKEGTEELNYKKELLHDSKELGKYTFMLIWHLLKSGGYTLYSALDYVDTQISKTTFLEKKGNKEIWNNIKQTIRNNVTKLLIGATLVGGGTYKTINIFTTPQYQHSIAPQNTETIREQKHAFGKRVASNIKLQTLNEINSR